MARIAMNDRQALLSLLDDLKRIGDDMRSISARRDTLRRNDLINSRKEFASKFMHLSAMLNKHDDVFGTEDKKKHYRDILSAFRAQMASHQAKYPAVVVGDENADYEQSSDKLSKIGTEMIDWIRANIV